MFRIGGRITVACLALFLFSWVYKNLSSTMTVTFFEKQTQLEDEDLMRQFQRLFNKTSLSGIRHYTNPELEVTNTIEADQSVLSNTPIAVFTSSKHGVTVMGQISLQITKVRTNLSKDELGMIKRGFYVSPIVNKKYKLILFWNEKSACTYWKRIMQFLEGLNLTALKGEVHNPYENGLTYLYDYSDENVTSMILDNTWTKVAFVREPRERILSCFFDKVLREPHFKLKCNKTITSFEVFLNEIKTCKDPHWESQVRAPIWLYKNMFIGKMSNITDFTVDLLKKIGAYTTDIQSKLREFRKAHYASNAGSILQQYYNDTKLEDTIFDMYKDDYEVFGFDKNYL